MPRVFEHVTFQVLKVQIMSSKTIKKIRIRFLIFHMVQRKWNSLGRNSDAHRQTLKVHKTWLELDRIRIFIISLKSFTKPEQAPSLMLHLQGLFGRPGDYMYLYFVDPPLLLFGWQMLRSLAIILNNDVWGIYNVQPSTATYNAAIKAESLWEFCFC